MQIYENINLKEYNTFHFDATAKYFVSIEKPADIQTLMQSDIYQENESHILGGGSNILLTQSHYDALIIHMEIMGKEVISETNDSVTLRVGAGEIWHDFVMRSIEQGYRGIENLALIPGCVGASPMQNIGAYGIEVQDVIAHVHGIDTET